MGSKIETENYDINLIQYIDLGSEKDYYDSLLDSDMGAKIHFNDGTTIKGFIIDTDNYHLYLSHKNNTIMLMKGQIKMIEPLPSKKMKFEQKKKEVKENK